MSRQTAPVILGLLGVFFTIALLLFGFFSSSHTRHQLLQQYQLEQGLAQMITLMQFNPDMEMTQGHGDLPFLITAFGIYDQTGTNILIRGQAPGSIDMDRTQPREDMFTRENSDRVVYIRRFPIINPGRVQGLPGPSESGPDSTWIQSNRRPAAIYIEAEPRNPTTNIPYSWKIYSLIVGLLSLGFIFFGYTYIKNQQYRRTLMEQESLVTLGEAARTISHEIKNPLSAIGLRINILQSQLPPHSIEDLNIIQQEVNRLDRLASKIGEFLKNPAGKPQVLDLIAFLRDFIRRFPNQAIMISDANESQENPESKASIEIDPDNLRSVVENILINALESGSPIPLNIVVSRKKHQIQVQFIDRGPGIDPELGSEVFKPFVTTKTRGSGIGLAIARRFAEAAHGTLAWKPNPEGGTIMILTLPEKS